MPPLDCFQRILAVSQPGHVSLPAWYQVKTGVAKCCGCCRRVKARVDFWAKFIGRLQGRGLLYIFLGSVQFGQHFWFTYISGGVMIAAGIACVVVARHAVGKLNKLHAAVVQSHANEPEAMRATFAKYDADHSGALELPELAQVATELGTDLTKNELVAVFNLLDVDKDGKIEIEEFSAWWTGDKRVDYSMV